MRVIRVDTVQSAGGNIMWFRWRVAALAAALSFVSMSAVAQDSAASEAEVQAAVTGFVQSLNYRSGEIALPQAQAHFRLTPDYRFLDAGDARRVLEELWGNPPDDSVLGMVVPTAAPLDGDNSWAVVVTFSDEGYVTDEDAASTDYSELLSEMQAATQDENAARKSAGFETVELVGWAVPPLYDSASKKLFWAKELAFQGVDGHTLNYDVRVLGRHGYLSLNAVAGMDQLPRVKTGMQQLLPMAEFDAGARYADFNESTDKLAGYGVAALIGGGLAAKTGLLAKIGALLLAFKKFLVIGVLALLGFVGKLWSSRREREAQRPPTVG